MDPLSVLHNGCVGVALSTMADGAALMVTGVVTVHPLVSLAVMGYGPAAKPVNEPEAWKFGRSLESLIVPVPPVAVARIEPLLRLDSGCAADAYATHSGARNGKRAGVTAETLDIGFGRKAHRHLSHFHGLTARNGCAMIVSNGHLNRVRSCDARVNKHARVGSGGRGIEDPIPRDGPGVSAGTARFRSHCVFVAGRGGANNRKAAYEASFGGRLQVHGL